MGGFMPGEVGGIPDWLLRKRGLLGSLLNIPESPQNAPTARPGIPTAREEPGDHPVLQQRPAGAPSLLGEEEIAYRGGAHPEATPHERLISQIGGQMRALEPQPQHVGWKRRLLQAVLTAAPTIAGGIFGGQEGAAGAATGTAESITEQQAQAERESVRRQQEHGRLATMMQQAELEQSRAAERAQMETGRERRFEEGQAGMESRLREQIASREGLAADAAAAKVEAAKLKAEQATALESRRQEGRMAVLAGRTAAQKELAKMKAAAAADPYKATTLTKNMSQLAITILPQLDKIADLITQGRELIGPGAGRWNEIYSGRAGFRDRSEKQLFMTIRDNVGMLQTAIMLAHARGRISNAMLEHFMKLYNLVSQDPDNALAAVGVAKDWMTGYANMVIPGALVPEGARVPGSSRGAEEWERGPNGKLRRKVR